MLEEFEKGDELMEQLGPGGAGKAEADREPQRSDRPAPRGKPGPGALERVQGMIDEALQERRPPPNPNDGIVRCTLDGSLQYMRESDCRLRGGRAESLDGGA